jgi:hypothetical protein
MSHTHQPPPGWPTIDDYDPDAPPRVEKAPPGMVWALAPNGDRVLAYLPPEAEQSTPQIAAEPDPWPKRMLAGGASTAAVLGVVGHYGPGLSQAGHAAEMAGIGVAATCAGVGALVLLVKGGMSSKGSQSVNVHVNVSATGGSARASSRSRGTR